MDGLTIPQTRGLKKNGRVVKLGKERDRHITNHFICLLILRLIFDQNFI